MTETDASFAAELLAVAQQAGALPAVSELLERWAGARVYIPKGRPDRAARAAEVARQLVFAGVGTRAAAAMVRERFSLSRRHASRLVRAAVDMRGQRMAALAPTMEP